MGFTPIRISTIKPYEEINFDVYIYFKERYLKYIETGRDLQADHLEKLKKQKIARFYITDEDEKKYQQFLDRVIDKILTDPTATTTEKVTFVEGTTSTALDKMQKDPGSAESFRMTQKAARGLRQIVSTNPDALREFYGKRAGAGDVLIKHCLNVCALATRLAELHECAEEDLDNLATAALLHDLGVTTFNEDFQGLFSKPSKEFTHEQTLVYRTHPQLSVGLLEKNPLANKAVLSLIMAHEEKISGQGYPNKINKMTLMEEILSLVNCYDKRVTIMNMSPGEALKDIRVSELGNYRLELINKFKEMLKKDGLDTL